MCDFCFYLAITVGGTGRPSLACGGGGATTWLGGRLTGSSQRRWRRAGRSGGKAWPAPLRSGAGKPRETGPGSLWGCPAGGRDNDALGRAVSLGGGGAHGASQQCARPLHLGGQEGSWRVAQGHLQEQPCGDPLASPRHRRGNRATGDSLCSIPEQSSPGGGATSGIGFSPSLEAQHPRPGARRAGGSEASLLGLRLACTVSRVHMSSSERVPF